MTPWSLPMPRDPLDTLARVRRMSHEEALAALALVLQAEEEADGLAKQAERTIAAETVAAGALDGDDGVVEAFAAWLPGARQRAAQARGACECAQADVSRARAVLAMTRAGVEAVATLLDEQSSRRAAAAARQEQHALDDAVRGRTGAGPLATGPLATWPLAT
jgi:flagellar export protein FliJ